MTCFVLNMMLKRLITSEEPNQSLNSSQLETLKGWKLEYSSSMEEPCVICYEEFRVTFT